MAENGENENIKDFIITCMEEQSNFRIFWCQYLVEGVVLDEKVTSMTPIKIKSYLLGTIFSHFY